MGTLDDREFALLHMLRFKELAEIGYRSYRKDIILFPEMSHDHCRVLWSGFLKLAKALGTLDISKMLLVKELKSALLAGKSRMPEEMFMRGVFVLKSVAESRKSQMKFEEGRAYVSALVTAELQARVLDRVKSNASLEALRKAVEDADAAKGNIIPSSPQESAIGLEYPFMNIDQYIGGTVRVPFGISFLDRLTGGGCREGTVMGFLGIQGGGKTMMTVQIAVAFAEVARQVIWFTYEQDFAGDIAERAITRTTGTLLKNVRNKEYGQLDESTKARLYMVKTKIGRYLAVRNFASLRRGPDGKPLPDDQQMVGDGNDIREVIRYMKREGRTPKIALFDWLGEAVERIAIARGVDPKENFQTIASEYIRDVNEVCAENKMVGIVFHQITADKKSMPPSWKPSAADAERFKAFSRNMYGCFVMGNARVNGSGARWLLTDKYRAGVPSETVIRMVGEEARFVDAEGWVIGPSGDFEDPSVVEATVRDPMLDERIREQFAQRILGIGEDF